MMRLREGAAVCLLVSVAMTACQSGGGRTDNSWYEGESFSARRHAVSGPGQDEPMAMPRARAPEVRVEQRGRAAGAGMMTASIAYPTGDEDTSALLIEEVMPREVRPGETFEYEIRATNLTQGVLRDVTITNEAANNLSIVGSTPEGQADDNLLRWRLGDLAPGATSVVLVNARAGNTGAATTCVSAAYASVLCAGPQVVQPALAIVRTVPPEVLACDPIAIRYEVRNTGTGVAENVVVRETLPQGLTTADGGQAVELSVGTLAPGQSKVVTATARPARPGRYESAARAEGAGLSAEAPAAPIVVRQPVLAIEADCGGGALMGGAAPMRFTVRNTGDARAENTVVTVAMPRGLQMVSGDAGWTRSSAGTSFNVGVLEPGATRTITMQARAVAAGEGEVVARATARCATEVSAECTARVQGTPDIGASLSDREGVVAVGANHSYTFELQNQGQIDLTGVTVRIALPEGLAFVSATGVEPPRAQAPLQFVLGSMRPGERRTFQVVVRAERPGEYLVTSETTAEQIRNPMREDEITTFVAR